MKKVMSLCIPLENFLRHPSLKSNSELHIAVERYFLNKTIRQTGSVTSPAWGRFAY